MASNNRTEAHSAPIPISGNAYEHHRRRSSVSSDSSSDSPPRTPPSLAQPKVSTSPSSPILSYLLAPKSPTTGPGAFPGFKRFGGPIMEDDEHEVPPAMRPVRRASIAGRFPPVQPVVAAVATAPPNERATGLLRRLSMGSSFASKPQVAVQPVSAHTVRGHSGTVPPPNSVSGSPTDARTVPRTKQRRATESTRRAPSPMGERILKGHFDGFN
ncbi:hypothetical protein PUNSTDRAFT_125937 [Punctularia strigosozonata HHB-11173 SS5]|uniref:uncharacterized protein n=1 Tax=Punctularia strigosozonata (strain HHB-11173) TaxID=741275 RepID=UPI000441872F|nr:uncharacterized protein PUNSTDRAFT_125937 [Punctularia strigosozonata HHB-11173 SS5]EIN09964.1 hypothetical protein PUNSTDRAFT_125937 [Punctularia strigosozonata HHB-11173 SS5]